MSNTLVQDAGTRRLARLPVLLVAVLAAGLAAALAALGTFGDHYESDQVREYVFVLGIIAVAAGLVFGIVVPRGLAKVAAGGTAVALSILGFLTIAIFWSGLPPVLAAGGMVLGAADWEASRRRFLSRSAVVIGALAVVGYVAVYVQDLSS